MTLQQHILIYHRNFRLEEKSKTTKFRDKRLWIFSTSPLLVPTSMCVQMWDNTRFVERSWATYYAWLTRLTTIANPNLNPNPRHTENPQALEVHTWGSLTWAQYGADLDENAYCAP